MRRALIVGTICALLGAGGVGFAQTETWTNFVLTAPTGGPTVSDVLACIEGSPGKTYNCSVSSVWAVLRSITNIWSGPQEFNPNALSLNGATSGQLVINAPPTASGTLTLPAGTTNFSATGGTSQVVKQVSAGAPFTVGQLACGDLSNAGSGCTASTIVSSVTAADSTLTITPTTGAVTAKVATNGVANANLAQMAAHTVKGNNTGVTANAVDLTIPQLAAQFTTPTTQVFASGSGTYTTPANATWLDVQICGGGGGGGGSGTGGGTGGTGGTTTFGTVFLSTTGGAGGVGSTSGKSTGGTTSGGFDSQGGGGGAGGNGLTNSYGGGGGSSRLSGGAPGGDPNTQGTDAAANSCAGGGGAGAGATAGSGGGGAGGGYTRAIVATPAATYAYAVGAGGTAGSAGTGGNVGGIGGAGKIIVVEHYD